MDVDFVINEDDLTPNIQIKEGDMASLAPPLVTVTLEDLREADRQVLRITDKDLPAIVRITDKDLPRIVKIGLADLPPDLSNTTTDCFHGTSWEAAKKVRKQGFRVGHGAAMGAGIYFSVGAMTIARSYLKSSRPCIIRARVGWGKVAYLDDSKIPSAFKSGGERATVAALKKGYNSFLSTSKYSESSPAIGVVLGKFNAYIKSPHIEVIELIDPRKVK